MDGTCEPENMGVGEMVERHMYGVAQKGLPLPPLHR